MLKTLWNRLVPPRTFTRVAKTEHRSVRLSVEALEDRTVPSATLVTDQLDYAPGSDVTFTGTGFQAGETINLDITSDTGTGAALVITDGGIGDADGAADGSFTSFWNVGYDNFGATLTATATGGISSETATTTFTDHGGIGAGSLAAPTGTSPTGTVLNNTHWKVLAGDTITGTITGATDAFVETSGPFDGSVVVVIQSSHEGNTFLAGTLSGSTITFTWTVQAPDGGDICETTIVSYKAHSGSTSDLGNYHRTNNELVDTANDGNNQPGTAAAGYAIVDSNGDVIHDLDPDTDGCQVTIQQTCTISGVKFYDANANGINDVTDGVVAGWTIYLDNDADFTNGFTASVMTDLNGSYTFSSTGTDAAGFKVVSNLCDNIWYVYEGSGIGSATWLQTLGGGTAVTGDPGPGAAGNATVGAYAVTLDDVNTDDPFNDFGNVKLGAGGGMTIGFWTNKNGKAVLYDGQDGITSELALLNGLCLVDTNGLDAGGLNGTLDNYTELRTYLLNATAENMAYMLSAQLTAMQLNVEAGKVSGTALVYAGDLLGFVGASDGDASHVYDTTGLSSFGFISINDLMTLANNALCNDDTAFASSSTDDTMWRAYMEALKDALDAANNNQNFLQTSC
jgi:hypothetical protein